MGIGGSVFVMFVLFQGADLLHPHPCMFFYRRACMCGYIHKQGAICTHSHLQRGFYIPFFDNVTWKRDLLVFSDNINCKSRKQKPDSYKIAASPPSFVVLQASLFHPLMMGFL